MHVNSAGTQAARNATHRAESGRAGMCELLGLSSNVPATVNVSLPKLAEHGRVSGTYNDGWGVGYYEGPDVRLMKDSAAVGDSEWIQFIANHDLRSPLVIAHTRKATRGTRSYPNAQPFVRELAGRAHLFAHNGDLPGIFKSTGFETARFNPIGETDSELAFCVLLDRMAAVWTAANAKPTLRQRFLVVSSFAAELRKLGPANFLYSDGELLFAHGHRRKHADTGKIEAPGLVSAQRRCRQDTIGSAASGLSIRGDNQQVALFASVPLTNEPWAPLAEGELVAACAGQLVARQLVDQALEVSDTFSDNPIVDTLGAVAD